MSLYTTLNRLFSKVATSLDGIKTGYDGTQYTTAGEAVRQQINDLHVAIEQESIDIHTSDSTLVINTNVTDANEVSY